MNRLSAAVLICSCALILMPLAGLAQTKDQGIRLYEEANILLKKARTSEDLKSVLKKYEKAISVFQKVGVSKDLGVATRKAGNIHLRLRQYDQARKYYEKALEISREVKDRKGEGSAVNNLGSVHFRRGKYDKAAENFEKALVISREAKDEVVEGIALNNLGKTFAAQRQYDRAVENYEKSLEISRDLKDRIGELRTLYNLGSVYWNWGQFDKALSNYKKSLAISREIKNRREEGEALYYLGRVLDDMGQLGKAVDCFEKALAIKRELKDRAGEGSTLNNLGLIYATWGDKDKAVSHYKQSLSIARELKDRQQEGTALNNLATVYMNWGKLDKAVSLLEKSLAIDRDLKDRLSEGGTLINLGNVYKRWGQNDKAVSHYKQSLSIARELKDRRQEETALNNLAVVYTNWGKLDKAVSLLEKSLAIDRDLKDRLSEGKTLRGLGSVHLMRGQYDTAASHYEKSLSIAKELKDRPSEGEALNSLGEVHVRWDQYDKARGFFEKSLVIVREMGDRRGQAIALGNLGDVDFVRGRFDKAVSYYEKSLAIFQDLKDPRGLGLSLDRLGNINIIRGQYGRAISYYERSLATYRDLRDPHGESDILAKLGNVVSSWGQFNEAVSYYERSLATYRDLRAPLGEAHMLENLGNVYASTGQNDKAVSFYEKSLAIRHEIGISTKVMNGAIAALYLDQGDYPKAEAYLKAAGDSPTTALFHLLRGDFTKAKQLYEKLLQIAEKIRYADGLFTAYTGLGLVYEGMKDNQKATEYFQKAVDFTEELRTSLTPAQREKFFDVKINGFLRTVPYEGLARVLIRMNKPSEAFKGSEYTKARVFAEAMSRLSGGEGLDIPAEVLKEDAQIDDQLAALKKSRQKAYEKQNKLLIKSLEPQITGLEKKRQAHIKMLRNKYPLFAATKYPEPMDLAQSALKDNEWVLSYDVTDTGVIVYLTKGKELVKGLFKPMARKELDGLVRKFREPLEMKPGDSKKWKLSCFDLKTGNRLADILLGDILSELPKGVPVMVVPDDSLGVLPFEMLVLNEAGKVKRDKDIPYVSGAQFFGDRNPISYYQSVTALTLARTFGKGKQAGTRRLVMDDPVFDSKDPRVKHAAQKEGEGTLPERLIVKLMSIKTELGLTFPRLPLTGQMGKSVKDLDPARTDEHTGMKAAKPVLFKKALDGYGSMVFATHGYFGKDLPGIQEPVLVLTLVDQPRGKDGFLRMSEVMGLKMNADIVALTACQTGLGRRISGEGTMGMGRAFQYAGAKSVLMSMWSVAQSSSVKLVESFFKHLKKGKSKLEALRLARKQIREAGYDHPFFWAPFILVGEVD